MTHIIRRGKWYHFKKRVPAAYADYFPRPVIQIPLKTDSPIIAQARAQNFLQVLDEYWAEMADKGPDPDEARFKKAVRIARLSGFSYRPIREIVSETSLHEFVERIDAAAYANDPAVAGAVLGTLKEPDITVSRALDIFLSHEKVNLIGRSEHQIRKWENPRKKAAANFIAVSGDKEIEAITRENILQFRDWWVGRIRHEGKAAGSANKDFGYLRQMLRCAADNTGLVLPVDDLFKKTMLKEQASSRRPFEIEFIQNVLLGPPVAGMNEECRLFLYAMADTGARVSELAGLEPQDIAMDHEIPHIKIRPNATRGLKTPQSERDIPLVGASLYAFRCLQGGFDHYHGKADLISNTINKFLRENDVLPSAQHSLYSLRHSFEDRLTAVEPPDKVQAALMGHKYMRPRYGYGPSLAQKREWLEKIALKI